MMPKKPRQKLNNNVTESKEKIASTESNSITVVPINQPVRPMFSNNTDPYIAVNRVAVLERDISLAISHLTQRDTLCNHQQRLWSANNVAQQNEIKYLRTISNQMSREIQRLHSENAQIGESHGESQKMISEQNEELRHLRAQLAQLMEERRSIQENGEFHERRNMDLETRFSELHKDYSTLLEEVKFFEPMYREYIEENRPSSISKGPLKPLSVNTLIERSPPRSMAGIEDGELMEDDVEELQRA
ncbi:hypothetical protein TWF102_008068 [Orbilia oligospora]|uniref:Uncharacterized protein n=1 Tax=Orbilia oligospora TaxID=2813651 RepID=A0A7C8JCA9_ORBOL|nr:hypothetical protein TWF102_008068 [Orbilia oligospora]